MNYYISDLHLGHANIIGLCNRPFIDVEDMDKVLVENWNSRVHRNDHVYIIGDLSFRSSHPVKEYLESLKGRKHLIVGNHDKKWLNELNVLEHFESVDMMLLLKDGSWNLVLCHYPMMSWPGRKAYHLYGHIHNDKPKNYWPLLKTYDRALNASVEINDYQPATFEELVVNNERWRSKDEDASRTTFDAFSHPNKET